MYSEELLANVLSNKSQELGKGNRAASISIQGIKRLLNILLTHFTINKIQEGLEFVVLDGVGSILINGSEGHEDLINLEETKWESTTLPKASSYRCIQYCCPGSRQS